VYELLTGSTQGEGKGKVTTVWSIGIFMYVIILKWKGQRHPSQCYVISYRLTLDDLVYRVPPRTPQLLRMTLFDPLTSQFDPQSTWQNTPSPLPQSRCPFSVVPLAFRANFGFRQHASKSLVPILFPFSSPQRRC
jgi:hypothetical protein